jgi:hypothetical protein
LIVDLMDEMVGGEERDLRERDSRKGKRIF